MSIKMQGMVGWGLGLQKLGSSWDAVSYITTVSQLGMFQCFAPSSVTSQHISPVPSEFGRLGCIFLRNRSSQVVQLFGRRGGRPDQLVSLLTGVDLAPAGRH